MRTYFVIPMLIIVILLSCKKEIKTTAPCKEVIPSVISKEARKKYIPSDWTIRPFGYDLSVKNIDLMGIKRKGC